MLIPFIGILIFASLGVYVNYFPILLIDVTSQLIRLIPITISGLGTIEAFKFSMYTAFLGISSGITAAMLSIYLIIGCFLNFLFYFICLNITQFQKKII
jgi:uncharacterized membrane protein YbhN (UPF0104 family)